jgi:leader peptidase (prepilin peptidase)/N-methyltransferase
MTQEMHFGQEDAASHSAVQADLMPNFQILVPGTIAAGLLSFLFLPWPLAAASTFLALFMVAGAEVDARTFLLPDLVTYGAFIGGVAVAPISVAFSASSNAWTAMDSALLQGGGTALVLYAVRAAYTKFRGTEGVGLGDIKLAAAIGAWLPFGAIPYCFLLATAAALLVVGVKQPRNIRDNVKLPFGAYLCPALWLIFFVSALRL